MRAQYPCPPLPCCMHGCRLDWTSGGCCDMVCLVWAGVIVCDGKRVMSLVQEVVVDALMVIVVANRCIIGSVSAENRIFGCCSRMLSIRSSDGISNPDARAKHVYRTSDAYIWLPQHFRRVQSCRHKCRSPQLEGRAGPGKVESLQKSKTEIAHCSCQINDLQ